MLPSTSGIPTSISRYLLADVSIAVLIEFLKHLPKVVLMLRAQLVSHRILNFRKNITLIHYKHFQEYYHVV